MRILFFSLLQASSDSNFHSLPSSSEYPSIVKSPISKKKYRSDSIVQTKLNNICKLSSNEVSQLAKIDSQISDDLDPLWRQKFRELVLDNMSIFVEHRKDLKPSRLPPLKLTLKPGCFPRKHKPRRMSEKQLAITRETVKEMLEGGQCVPSCSEVGFPTLLVAKKDGKHRMVVDYR